MDVFSFEDLLRGLATKYEELRLENINLGGCATRNEGSLAPILLGVGTPAVLENQDWTWALPKLCPGEGLHDTQKPCRPVAKLPPPSDPKFHSLDCCDVELRTLPRSAHSITESDSTVFGKQSVVTGGVAASGYEANVRDGSGSAGHVLSVESHFHRLDDVGSGLLTAPRCLAIMEGIQELGIFPHTLPHVEQIAAAILRFTTDSHISQRRAEEIGLDVHDFAHLMIHGKQAVRAIGDQDGQRLMGLLYKAFCKEKQHRLGLEARSRSFKTPAPPEDQYKNMLDILSSSVIFLNALVIGVSAEVQPDSDFWWFVEIGCTAFFTCEMIFNMRAAGSTRSFFFGDNCAWNNFDFVVVSIALFDLAFTATYRAVGPHGSGGPDTGSFTIIKMARLGRLARLVRVLRFKIFNELKSMIQGVLAGLRVLFWAIVLFFFFIYLVAVVVRKTMGEAVHPDHGYVRHKSFETVPVSMFTLFRCFTDGCTAYDGTPLTSHLYDYYGFSFMFGYMLIYLFVTIGIFNLIMAIFIDNVMEASLLRKKEELGANAGCMELKLKELIAKLSLRREPKSGNSIFARMAAYVQEKVLQNVLTEDKKRKSVVDRTKSVDRFFNTVAPQENLLISKEVFIAWLEDSEMVDLLAELDICVANKTELFDVLDCDLSGELEVPELIEGLMKLRGPADKCDAVAALLGVRHMTRTVEEMNETLTATTERVGEFMVAAKALQTSACNVVPAPF